MDSDGITNEVECAGAESNFLLNGSFETPAIPPGTFRTFVPSADFRWRTTASDGRVEVWNNFADGGSVPTPLAGADGAQLAELNANVPSALYQDVTTSPGDIYVWALAHRGRAGVDVMSLQIGAPGAPDQVVSISDGNTAWGQHEGADLVPPGQTVTRFQFEATASASGSLSIGNFLDAIDFTPCPDTDGDGIGDFADPDSDADGFPDLIEGTDDDGGVGAELAGSAQPDAPSHEHPSALDVHDHDVHDHDVHEPPAANHHDRCRPIGGVDDHDRPGAAPRYRQPLPTAGHHRPRHAAGRSGHPRRRQVPQRLSARAGLPCGPGAARRDRRGCAIARRGTAGSVITTSRPMP